MFERPDAAGGADDEAAADEAAGRCEPLVVPLLRLELAPLLVLLLVSLVHHAHAVPGLFRAGDPGLQRLV